MSELEKGPLLGQTYKWAQLDEYGRPVPGKEGYTAPKAESFKFEYGGKDHTVHALVDTGTHGFEYPFKFTLPRIMEYIDKWNIDNAERYDFFKRFVSGPAQLAWDEVLSSDEFKDATSRTNGNWELAIARYFERLEMTSNIRDNLQESLLTIHKKIQFDPKTFARRLGEIYRIIKSPYVKGDEPVMKEVTFKRRVYKAMPTEHRGHFAKHYKTITDEKPTFEELVNFFEGCDRDDENTGEKARRWAVHVKQCDARKAKIEAAAAATTKKDKPSDGANRSSRNSSYRSSGGNKVYYRNGGGDRRGDDRRGGHPRRYEGYHRSERGGGYRGKGGRGNDRRPDHHRGRDRDRRDDRHRDDRKGHDAHHVDDRERSSSRSRSRSRGRDRSPSRSSSRSRSRDSRQEPVDTYHVDSVPSPPGRKPSPPARLDASKRIPKKKKPAPAKQPGPRYRVERLRETVKYVDGKPVGFGSFYKRPFGDYSREEFGASQGHQNRVRTIDLLNADVKRRIDSDDDSEEPSDWYDRCKVEPPKRSFNHFD